MYTKQYHDGEQERSRSRLQLTRIPLAVADQMSPFSLLTAYPAAKLYFPARGIDSWRKKGWLPADESQVFAYGAGCKPGEAVADPFEATTRGEIKSADFGKAFINEVRSRTKCYGCSARRRAAEDLSMLFCRIRTGYCFPARSDPHADRSRPALEPASERAGTYTCLFPTEQGARSSDA